MAALRLTISTQEQHTPPPKKKTFKKKRIILAHHFFGPGLNKEKKIYPPVIKRATTLAWNVTCCPGPLVWAAPVERALPGRPGASTSGVHRAPG